MIKYKNAVEQTQTIEDITCNMCGETIEKDSFGYFQEYFHAEKLWGYPSTKDGTGHTFDLCEACYDKIVSQFKIQCL